MNLEACTDFAVGIIFGHDGFGKARRVTQRARAAHVPAAVGDESIAQGGNARQHGASDELRYDIK